jgi:hypothetical protein
VHVPHEYKWAHEVVADETPVTEHPRFRRITALNELPPVLATFDP